MVISSIAGKRLTYRGIGEGLSRKRRIELLADDTGIETQRLAASFTPLGPQPWSQRTIHEGDMVPPSPDERIAHAMEYIADYIGRIDRKLDKIIERLDGPKVSRHDQK